LNALDGFALVLVALGGCVNGWQLRVLLKRVDELERKV
jgi:hypothetical protein